MKPALNKSTIALGIILVGTLLSGRLLSASCGDSLSAMAGGGGSVHSQTRPIQPNSASSGDNAGKSMVGLWHIQFTVGDQTIQAAYRLWNAGGTEVHNPNIDPRGEASAWGCGNTLRTALSSSLTACGTMTRTETSWEPLTSVKQSLWVKAAIRTVVRSPWISTTPPATSSRRSPVLSRGTAFRLTDSSLLCV